MEIIAWSEELSVGVMAIDEEHKKLIAMINDLGDAMSRGEGRKAVANILSRLTEYTRGHFFREENLFNLYNYPEKETHKKEHAAFVDKVSQFTDDYNKGNVTLSLSIMKFLRHWIIEHIMKSDKRYMDCFKEHGLT